MPAARIYPDSKIYSGLLHRCLDFRKTGHEPLVLLSIERQDGAADALQFGHVGNIGVTIKWHCRLKPRLALAKRKTVAAAETEARHGHPLFHFRLTVQIVE